MGKRKEKKQDSYVPSAEEIIFKYGTYNIQPTAGTENEFPEIAQGESKISKPR